MAFETLKRSTGSPGRAPLSFRGQPWLTTFDPIKDVTGQKDTVTFNGKVRPSVIGVNPSNAAGNPVPRVLTPQTPPTQGIGSQYVARALPSVPRRLYQPTIIAQPRPSSNYPTP